MPPVKTRTSVDARAVLVVAMIGNDRERLLEWRMSRSILHTQTSPARFDCCSGRVLSNCEIMMPGSQLETQLFAMDALCVRVPLIG
jgi:hypothetical protein